MLKHCPEQVATCSGCFGALKPSGRIPQVPHDLVVVSLMQRNIPIPGREALVKFCNAYFHLRQSCIARNVAEFSMQELIVTDEVKKALTGDTYMLSAAPWSNTI